MTISGIHKQLATLWWLVAYKMKLCGYFIFEIKHRMQHIKL